MATKKNKEINKNNLVTIKPITDNQKEVFSTWKKGKNQFLFGCAGTGKTFISLYLALNDIFDLKSKYEIFCNYSMKCLHYLHQHLKKLK